MKIFNKTYLGIILGTIVGIINVLPMILQKVAWDANISTFLTWVIVGFFISTTKLKFHGIIKGIIISILIFIPSTIFVIESNLTGAIWTIVMTLIFGGLLGYLIDKLEKQQFVNL
ncbi:hypothetical protein K2F40_04040 [Clostridium sp. CM028]|uniref:hypothetical protein n=1 Tax=unclassified Clostridium TaxID=2614128 RepID=UPI001C0DA898|nr:MULTISPECIES: hypothetical protein [unclassified Clostridium]MBU3093302.1 hypothetical protein [Clostridium sp. CF011]MBW9148147.1 hypothetical protein [Clostridium sp. CM028]WAG70622.1 hypothetical protein LL036_04045 [Clostridium sp. CF011]WLC62266.1 hypothetical protein KTC94_02990 [Clostridium sp. CM028]